MANSFRRGMCSGKQRDTWMHTVHINVRMVMADPFRRVTCSGLGKRIPNPGAAQVHAPSWH